MSRKEASGRVKDKKKHMGGKKRREIDGAKYAKSSRRWKALKP